MESSSKRKRIENDDGDNDSDEADIERFSEIVEKLRGPYDWFRAKMSDSAMDLLRTVTNRDDPRKTKKNEKKKAIEADPKRGDVWMPCFLLEDFEEDEVIKFRKSTAETAAAATDLVTIGGGGEEKKANSEELDLRLSL